MNAKSLQVRIFIPSLLLVAVSLLVSGWVWGNPAQAGEEHPTPSSERCRLEDPAFCDTFDAAHPGGRGGDLDETKWSVARVGGGINPSQGMLVQWFPSNLNRCNNLTSVQAPDDFAVCNNHYMESIFDSGDYLYNSIRIRQLFDFSERTGKLVFDVDAKSADHGWWIEAWIVDEPVPGPYVGAPGNSALPRNGIGFVFGPCDGPDSGGLDKVFIVKDYVVTNSLDSIQGDTNLHNEACFTTHDNQHNMLEIRIGTQGFELWGSDAHSDQLKLIAWSDGKQDNWSLPFDKGYVNLLHVQYDAEKFGHTPHQTYHWDNIGFDGPIIPLSRGYDIPNAGIDSMDPRFPAGTLNLGYLVDRDGTISTCCENGDSIPLPSFIFQKVDLLDIKEATLNLNLWYFHPGDRLYFRFNQNDWRSYEHPFPDSNWGTRTLSIPVPVSDLVQGENVLELKASGDEDFVAANIDLELTLNKSMSPLNSIYIPLLQISR